MGKNDRKREEDGLSEDFVEQVMEKLRKMEEDFDAARYELLFDSLREQGVALPHPDFLTDEQLSPVLRDLIQALSHRRVYLHNTDYLSDRELYERLWHDSLRQEGFRPFDPDGMDFYHIDYTMTGMAEDLFCYFKYLASEKERSRWAEENPDYEMPARERPPYDRDRLLPRP